MLLQSRADPRDVMGVRDYMNEHRGVTVGATIGTIVLAIAGISWFSAASHLNAGGSATSAFFTDDGKTFFVDDASRIPPFEHNGKPAYGCYVFTNDGGKTKYVAWLYRYTAEGKKRLESLRTANRSDMAASPFHDMEVKRPGSGDTAWVAAGDPRARQIQMPPSIPNTMPQEVHAD